MEHRKDLNLIIHYIKIIKQGGNPGLVVKGGDTQSEGCEFESRRRILDGYFPHLM